jgi:hypothetical protein
MNCLGAAVTKQHQSRWVVIIRPTAVHMRVVRGTGPGRATMDVFSIHVFSYMWTEAVVLSTVAIGQEGRYTASFGWCALGRCRAFGL